jgi:dienelactone hydrolase
MSSTQPSLSKKRTGREHGLAAAAIVVAAVMLAAACGSSAGPAAAPTTEAAVSTSQATVTATAAAAVVPGPPETPFESSSLPDTPAGRQLAWLLDAVQRLPIPPVDIEAHFAPPFRALISPEQLNALFAQPNGVAGSSFLGVAATTPTSIDTAVADGAGRHLVLSLAVDGEGRIAGLQPKPIPLVSRAEVGLDPITLPEPTGPLPVGTDTVVASDAARADRRIPAQLWYPAGAEPGAETAPAPYAAPATLSALAERLAVPLEDVAAVRTRAALAPDSARGHGRFPVVVFSPGYGVTRPLYSGLGAELASHGYVVAVVDHPGDGSLVEFPDGTTVAAPEPSAEVPYGPEAGVATRVADAGVVLDLLERLDTEVGGPLHEALDLTRVAFVGHSLGGATAAETMRVDATFRVGVNLDGSMVGEVVQRGLDRPFLLMGTADEEEDESWTSFRAHTPAAQELAIEGTGHMSYSDLPALAAFRPADEPKEAFGIGTIDPARSSSVVSAYLVAFLDHHLRDEAEPLLDGPSPEYPEARFR